MRSGPSKMGFELERILYETEDFLRKHLGSSAQRAAKKRRAQRRLEEIGRRVQRACIIFAVLMGAMVAWAILVAPHPIITWFFGGLTIFFIALISAFWETKRPVTPTDMHGAPALPLAELAARAEDALLDRCRELPGRAQGAAAAQPWDLVAAARLARVAGTAVGVCGARLEAAAVDDAGADARAARAAVVVVRAALRAVAVGRALALAELPAESIHR